MRFSRIAVVHFSLVLLLVLNAPAHAHGNFSDNEQAAAFAADMQQRHGFSADEMRALLADARYQEDVIARMNKPAERLGWDRYRKIFLTETRIAGGVKFWSEHADTVARAEQQYGVDSRYIVAIIGVETAYGRFTGKLRVLDALATLAFAYPRRASFFRRELEQYLLLTRDEKLPVGSMKGSYAGAMGVPQFIPSSYRAYAVDFDGDGVRDLIASVDDAIGSVANYLAVHGWQRGATVTLPATASADDAKPFLEQGNKPHTTLAALASAGVGTAAAADDTGKVALISLGGEQREELWVVFANFYAITRYNPSNLYAMAVTQLAAEINQRKTAAGSQD